MVPRKLAVLSGSALTLASIFRTPLGLGTGLFRGLVRGDIHGLGLFALGAGLSPLVTMALGGLTDMAFFLLTLRMTGGSLGGRPAVRSGLFSALFSLPSTTTLGMREISSSLKSLMSLGESSGVVSEHVRGENN